MKYLLLLLILGSATGCGTLASRQAGNKEIHAKASGEGTVIIVIKGNDATQDAAKAIDIDALKAMAAANVAGSDNAGDAKTTKGK